MFEKKYQLVFIRKHFEALFVEKVIPTNILTDLYSLGKLKFVVNINKPTYMNGKTKFYFFDIDTGSQLNFVENKPLLNPSDLDMIVGQKIIRELTSGVLDNNKEKAFLILLGCILGGLIVAVGMIYYYSGKIQELLIAQPTDPVVIVNSLSIWDKIWRFVFCR